MNHVIISIQTELIPEFLVYGTILLRQPDVD